MPLRNQNCDMIPYNDSILDTKSFFLPVAKNPSYHFSLPEKPSHIPTDTQPCHTPVTKESSHDVNQRSSLSDLHSHYWELLKRGQINEENDHSRKPLISQITKEMTVVNEESEVKMRIASLLGKNMHSSLGCYNGNLLKGCFFVFLFFCHLKFCNFICVILTWGRRHFMLNQEMHYEECNLKDPLLPLVTAPQVMLRQWKVWVSRCSLYFWDNMLSGGSRLIQARFIENHGWFVVSDVERGSPYQVYVTRLC